MILDIVLAMIQDPIMILVAQVMIQVVQAGIVVPQVVTAGENSHWRKLLFTIRGKQERLGFGLLGQKEVTISQSMEY
jgi:hypothetical protein